MDNELLERFQEALNKRANSNAIERLRITQFDEPTICNMLMRCYQAKVEMRRVHFVADDNTKQNVSKAAKWLTGNYKVGLILYGGVGNGKTTLARSICELISILFKKDEWTGKGVVKITALELSKIMLDSPDRYNKIKDCELLFIDDIGIEPASVKSWGNECSPVTELIYSRYDKQLFTLATSNLNDAELKDRYGIRISDRFNEMFEKVYFTGKSYRK